MEQTDAGTFTGNRFVAKRPGNVTLVAKAGGITKTLNVHVITGQEVAELSVSPAKIYIAPGQTIQLEVYVKTKKGQTIKATPLSVKVTSDSPDVSVDDRLRLTAGERSGKANITVSYDGVAKTVPVNIGVMEQPWLTFDNLTGPYHKGYPESLNNNGSFTTVGVGSEPVFRTRKAARLNYNFAGAPRDDVRISYGRLGSSAVTMPGQPIGIGLWVYGDGSGHWLRAEVIDANGKLHYVDLAEKVDWTGWKQVKGYFTGSVSYPVQLRSIYLVNKPEGTESRPERGTLYFDEVSLLLPFDSAKQVNGSDISPAAPGKLSLGSELDMSYSFQASAAFLAKARIDVQSVAGRQMPGYVPADYSFTVKPVSLQPGKADQFAQTGATIKLIPKNWIKGKGIGLLYVNEATQTLDTLVGQMDPQGNWVYKINAYGTYIPYYLDIPANLPFKDIVNHPAREEIVAMAAKGYVKGLSADVFGPEVSLTRAQYVTLLARVFHWELPKQPRLPFKDAIPEYARGAVQAAVSKGIVKGYEDGTFRPNQAVTRAEAAVILDRVLKQKPAAGSSLADQQTWPSWAAESIKNVVGLGLIDPIGNKYEPNQPTTRAVFVVALYRMLEKP